MTLDWVGKKNLMYPNSWMVFLGENPIEIKMDDLGVPPFVEPPIFVFADCHILRKCLLLNNG